MEGGINQLQFIPDGDFLITAEKIALAIHTEVAMKQCMNISCRTGLNERSDGIRCLKWGNRVVVLKVPQAGML